MVKASFFEKVYEVVRKVPKGKVVSYGDIANYIGGSARMVGWAMNAVGSKVIFQEYRDYFYRGLALVFF